MDSVTKAFYGQDSTLLAQANMNNLYKFAHARCYTPVEQGGVP